MDEKPGTVGAHLDEVLKTMRAELALMHEVVQVEQARSDFLWDRALQREEITEEEWASVRDPETPLRGEAARVRHSGQDLPAG